MGEHSIMDGTPTARMCDDILSWLHSPSFDHGSPSAISTNPSPLDWDISPPTHSAIASASAAALALIDSQTLTFHRTAYGKASIKRFSVSPDSWAQMIIQLAYRRLLHAHNKPRTGATYEAATTRRFFKGRTEAIRVVTAESDRWVASMDDPTVDKATKRTLFLDAAKIHLTLARESGNGHGVDRLILGAFLPGACSPNANSPLILQDSNYR
jgi:carnitine O-acetyltransferase